MKDEELKVGKWYKLDSGRSVLDRNCYMKFNDINNGLVMSNEYIYNGKYNSSPNTGTNFGAMNTYSYKLINLQEIRQYLPNGHKDKFSPISKEQKEKLLNLIREI